MTTATVSIAVPVWDPKVYPRAKWSTSTIERYADALEVPGAVGSMTTDAECITCGHPQLRPEGHASFCEPWNAANTLPALASTSSSTVPPAVSQGGVDGAASPRARSALGEVRVATVGPSSPQLPGRSTHAKTPAVAAAGVQNNAG